MKAHKNITRQMIKKTVTFFIVLLLFACNKDDSGLGDSETFTVTGKVLDENNVPISGAEVMFENQSTTTSTTGDFSISANKNQTNRQFIVIKSSDKFEAYRAFSTLGINEKNLQVIMMDKGTVVSFNSSTGVIVQNSGGTVTIPSNAIQKENGEIYNGQVTASVRMLNTSQQNFEELMQGGDFAGVNSSSQSGQLRSYGFYAAELEDNSGNKLNLRTGFTASFSLPLASNDVNIAPQTVKLWHFDKEQGIWVENGFATKQGNKYIGNVPHFSEWNCDDWYSTTTISGNWTQVPSSNCNGSIDVINVNSSTNETFIIYNMPTASSGTFYFNNGVLNGGSCSLYALYMPDYNNTSDIFFSVPSQAAGWIVKTGPKSFTVSCTLSNDFSNVQNPTSVIGFNGSGTY